MKDSAFLLNIIAGKDENDDTTIDNGDVNYLSGIEDGIEGKKIGIVSEMTKSDGLSKDVSSATRDAIQSFEKLGATIETRSQGKFIMRAKRLTGCVLDGMRDSNVVLLATVWADRHAECSSTIWPEMFTKIRGRQY